nr:hypothetical protein [Fusarium oxysporum]
MVWYILYTCSLKALACSITILLTKCYTAAYFFRRKLKFAPKISCIASLPN